MKLNQIKGKTISKVKEEERIGEPWHNTKSLILYFTDGTLFDFRYGAE
jgi:hypothetical protein